MKQKLLTMLLLASASTTLAQNAAEKIEFVNFSKVNITDNFWKPKIDKAAVVTIPVCIDQTEVKTPRIRNFEKVARKKGEKHEGIFYDDSDVYKALEAIAYSLKTHPNKSLEAKADEWIDKIAAAQQPDGYLNTMYTLNEPQNRYTDMSMHEDYNCGHMIEAAVAYYNVTGKRKFLDVAIKWANHFNGLFGPGKRDWVTGQRLYVDRLERHCLCTGCCTGKRTKRNYRSCRTCYVHVYRRSRCGRNYRRCRLHECHENRLGRCGVPQHVHYRWHWQQRRQ